MESKHVQPIYSGAKYVHDENARRCCAAARDLLLRAREERYVRNTAEAIAEGFSSLEEKRQHSMDAFEKAEKRHEKWMEEQAALVGKTIEEFEREYWAPQQFVPRYFNPPLPNCTCEDHPIPFFCAESLIEYNSQKLEEELPSFITDRHHVPLHELRIDPGDTSKRLSYTTLEKEWARTPPRSCKLPIWTKGDKILQQIIHPSSPPSTQGVSSRGASVPSLVFTVTEQDANTAPSITTPTELSHDAGHEVQQVSPLSRSSKTRLRPDLKNNTKQRRTELLHRSHQRPEKISKTPKRSVPPAMRTRSRKLTKFYELG